MKGARGALSREVVDAAPNAVDTMPEARSNEPSGDPPGDLPGDPCGDSPEDSPGERRGGARGSRAGAPSIALLPDATREGPGRSGAARALRVEVIDEVAALGALGAEWRDLASAACDASVFLGWEWHRIWWEIFARPGDRLHIVAVRDGTALVGLLPLYASRARLSRRITLRLIGTGESQTDEVATEYGDVLAHAAYAQAVADTVVAHLATFEGWTRVAIPCVLDGALLLAACRRHPTLARLEKTAGFRYRVSLDEDEETYLGGLEKSRRKRIARSRRALERDGGFATESTRDGAGLAQSLQYLADLNHERQTGKGRKSVFASERFRLFHARLGRELLPHGEIDIVSYRLGPHLLAVLYCFHDACGTHYYQSGFATREANRYMPLTLAHLDQMQRGRDAGRPWYDLMRGYPPCYKDDFGCERTPMLDLTLYRTPWVRALAHRTHVLRRWTGVFVRSCRERLARRLSQARSRSLPGS